MDFLTNRHDSFVNIVSILSSVLVLITPCFRMCNEVNLPL